MFNVTDLTTAIFALGLHQEPSKIGLPFFILELHRILFWTALSMTKVSQPSSEDLR